MTDWGGEWAMGVGTSKGREEKRADTCVLLNACGLRFLVCLCGWVLEVRGRPLYFLQAKDADAQNDPVMFD